MLSAFASRPLMRQLQCAHLDLYLSSAQHTATRCSTSSVQGRHLSEFTLLWTPAPPPRFAWNPLPFGPPRAQPCSLRRHSGGREVSIRGRGAASEAATMGDALPAGEVFFLDEFAVRQWDNPNCTGTRINYDKTDFVAKVHQYFGESCGLVAGYAPFCKHVFVPNFVGAHVGALSITEENRHLLRSAYEKRRPEELAVLARWFPADQVKAPEAKFLDVILYSREQLSKEYDAMPEAKGDPALLPRAPWGIISIKAQEEDYETPMQPITVMRNSLGKDEGGSGVPVNRQAYEESVAYWQGHAAIAAGTEPEGE